MLEENADKITTSSQQEGAGYDQMVYGAEDEGAYDEAYDGGYDVYQEGGQDGHHAVEDPYYNEYDVDQVEEQH